MSYTRQTQHVNGNEVDFIQTDSVVFPQGTPTSATAASGTLTLSGAVVDGETVTIGSNVYEFKASGSANTGHIKVDVSGGLTAVLVKVALKNTINANETQVIATNGGTGDTVVLTAIVKASIGNAIATTETMTNASWGNTTLTGGIDGIATQNVGIQFEDATAYYLTNSAGDVYNVKWYKITKTAI